MGAVFKLVSLLIILYVLFWVTIKVGTGLGNWFPFALVCLGTALGILTGVMKWTKKK
jgi:hypothetical protein